MPARAKVTSENPAVTFDPAFVVGVGTSAGGLEALGALLDHLTLDRLALIVVQHLAPTHDSMLVQLLAKLTRVPVMAAEHGLRVEPRHVYVIRPNADLALLDGVLQVTPLATRPGPRLPINSFFRSLADDQGERAIGVILSGTGSDGALGLKAIKAAGGITFVQEPASAKFDGMPRQAMSSGAADACLTPDNIALELNALGKQPDRGRLHFLQAEQRADAAKILV